MVSLDILSTPLLMAWIVVAYLALLIHSTCFVPSGIGALSLVNLYLTH